MREKLATRVQKLRDLKSSMELWSAISDWDAGHIEGVLQQMNNEIEFLEELLERNEQ